MPAHEIKPCPSCGQQFECKAGNITQCQCFSVSLTRAEMQAMSLRYDDCLCATCLADFKTEYQKMSTLESRIKAAETSLFKVVFPNTTNHYDTLFGGTALQLMDEAAFIAATRFARKRVVTVSSSKVDFNQPIPADTIIEIVGKVIRVGNTSLDVEVCIYVEEMYVEKRARAITGTFTFVALDENKRPIPIV